MNAYLIKQAALIYTPFFEICMLIVELHKLCGYYLPTVAFGYRTHLKAKIAAKLNHIQRAHSP